MSVSRPRATDLLSAYDLSLEQQIAGRGSSLVCQDKELWMQVEVLLREGDAQETHCLGLEPLRLMEESLKAAASGGRAKARGGLRGLAKAFEVVEQAALNLYLGPWREEYKVVKMYSGTFTHYIKPVLSMPQIEKLFGLLGYQVSSPRHEQLRLRPPRVGPASLDDLLRLSCAFFLARCECRQLLKALGKNAGEAQWELSVVMERLRGHSLQVALDNTKKKLEVNQPKFEGDLEMDLYTDEQVNGGQRGTIIEDDESPHSSVLVTQSTASLSTAKVQSNGVTSSSTSSSSMPTRENVHFSTLNCQLTKTSRLEANAVGSASMQQRRRTCEESTSQSHSLQGEAMGPFESADEVDHFCRCLQSPHLFCVKLCIQCNAYHNITCALLEHCTTQCHRVVFPDMPTEEMGDLRAASLQAGSLMMSTSPTLTSSSADMSSLTLCDDPKSIISSLQPIGYHDCCNLAQPDPQVLCLTCRVFHSSSCRGIDVCKMHHKIKLLGVCRCGRTCSRKPLVLCRYCGNDYCRDCWYRNPVVCACGQTFDQSSSV